MENPYSAKVQEQLKITNLRVQLLKRQSCPCQRNHLNAKPQHFTHYAIYDFIVKGSCFCNGHADQCIPIDGFRPVKAPGAFHVVCKTSPHLWKKSLDSLNSLTVSLCIVLLLSSSDDSLLQLHGHPRICLLTFFFLIFHFWIIVKHDNQMPWKTFMPDFSTMTFRYKV